MPKTNEDERAERERHLEEVAAANKSIANNTKPPLPEPWTRLLTFLGLLVIVWPRLAVAWDLMAEYGERYPGTNPVIKLIFNGLGRLNRLIWVFRLPDSQQQDEMRALRDRIELLEQQQNTTPAQQQTSPGVAAAQPVASVQGQGHVPGTGQQRSMYNSSWPFQPD
ncbi:hypothetical protein VTI74DRAFT_5800 [Chaetomium olivicolor]